MDDTKLLKAINTLEDVEDLQANLDSLYAWQEANNMAWNGSKFQALRMGAIPSLIQDSILFTPNMEEPIEVVEEAKDLGVIIDNKMSFKAQRAKAQSKASQKAGWVLRTFSTRALAPLRTI